MTEPRPAIVPRTTRKPMLRLFRFTQVTVGGLARGLFRIGSSGVGRIPKKGPVILVSNHTSNLDPVLVVSVMRRPIFHLGKHTLFTKPMRRYFFERMGGQIPVDRERGGNKESLAAAIRALEAGRALAIYPEGSRSPDGRLRRGRTGVARLALMTGAPVIPVGIEGAFDVWPKGRKLPRPFRRTRVVVGHPKVYPKDVEHADDPATLRRVTDDIMVDLAKLLGQTYDPTTVGFAKGSD